MYFKVLLTVNDIKANSDSTIEFEVSKPYPIKIEIKNPPKEFLEKNSDKSVSFCDIYAIIEPNASLLEIFRKIDLENKSNSNDSNNPQEVSNKPYHVQLKQDLVPKDYVDYLNQIENNLKNTARQLIGLLRWTNNYIGHHDPIGSRGAYWSFDNIHWYNFPMRFQFFRTRNGYTLHLNENDLKRITELLDSDISEPIYHELFREAWSQRVENPRSAIAIGVAAAEVGVKVLISKIIPDAKWLVEHVITPPICDILSKYLPNLQSLNQIKSKCVIPKSLIKTTRELVEKRNKLVHVGTIIPDKKELEEKLKDIKDLLLLLDYYGGFEFSLSHVRKETIGQLGIDIK
jgi:hypothetical protein